MLVLTRKTGGRILIDHEIEIVVTKITGNRVSIAIDAPKDVSIRRGEVVSRGTGTHGGQRPASERAIHPTSTLVAT